MASKLLILVLMVTRVVMSMASHDYGDALTKSIMFFEGQRSGKLPPAQRMTWRKDSALNDGKDFGMDLVGGYYDAGDNVKFNFPMAYSTTLLAWSVLEFGNLMGDLDRGWALEAIKWGTDYFLKCTKTPGIVVAMVGDPIGDHNCWERPEDMDTPRTSYLVSAQSPGSEVSAEIAAALASTSMLFKDINPKYSKLLIGRAKKVFAFADKYRGSYNISVSAVCPFYCDFGGYIDELAWAAAWIYKATNNPYYRSRLNYNYNALTNYGGGNFAEFGWDTKNAGIAVLVSQFMPDRKFPFASLADKFVCTILPESPTKSVQYSPGGLMFKQGGSNMQHSTALSFLLLAYAGYLETSNRGVQCGYVYASPTRLRQFAKTQVDYILGSNPLRMSYMVGYGNNFPKKIHHRASSIPCLKQHPQNLQCKDGTPHYQSHQPNPNLLTGALSGGPSIDDSYQDDRTFVTQSEPTTYMNAPFVGLLAYFKGHP